MKICLICPFSLKRLTGTPIRSKDVLKALKINYSVVTISEAGEDMGIDSKLYQLGRCGIARFSLRSIKILIQEKPDVIHVITTLGIISALTFKLFFRHRTKIVFEMHGWGWFELKGQNVMKRFIFLIIDWLGILFSSRVISMSYSELRFLSKLTINKKKIHVVWGSVEKEINYNAVPDREKIVVGYVGNSSWWQGIEYIIQSAKIIEDKHQNIHFKFVGFDHSDTKRFPELHNVTYLGKICREDLDLLLLDCDIFISPRIKESVTDLQFPHKLLEYMAAGRPIIASDVSDQAMILVNAECGLIINLMDNGSITGAILELSNNKQMRIKMGKNAILYSKKYFSFDTFVGNMNKVYEGLN